MEKLYLALLEYLWDKKLLVDYIFIVYKLLNKYWESLYNYLDKISQVDEKFSEILKFFQEEKFSTADIYVFLNYLIEKTWINVLEIKASEEINLDDFNLNIEWDKVVEKVKDDVGVKIRTIDSKIYKRFLLNDIRKILKLED